MNKVKVKVNQKVVKVKKNNDDKRQRLKKDNLIASEQFLGKR